VVIGGRLGQDVDGIRERAEVLRGGRRRAAFEADLGHLALDDTRIGARGAVRESAGGEGAQEALVEQVMLGGGDELDIIKSDADQLDGMDEAQARGREVGRGGGLGHEGAHGIVG